MTDRGFLPSLRVYPSMRLPSIPRSNRLLVIALGAVLIAGCSQPAKPVQPEPVALPDRVHFASGWFNGTITDIRIPTSNFGLGDASCVEFFDVEIVDGWMMATWDAPAPTNEELRLSASDAYTARSVEGPSPLKLDLGNLTAHRDSRLLIFVQEAEPLYALIEVEMRLSWEFHYRGPEEVLVQGKTCIDPL